MAADQSPAQSKRRSVEVRRVDGPDPRYYRVWIGTYCVADGVGLLRARVTAFVLRRLAR